MDDAQKPSPPPSPPQDPLTTPPKDRAAEKLEAARRHLFEAPPEIPFWRTAEFQRVGALILVLIVLGMFGVMFYWNRISHEKEVAEQEAEHASLGAPVPPDPALREQRMRTLFEGALADTQNGEDFHETGGYTILVRSLSSYSADDVKAKAKRWLDHEGVLADPDGWRGEFVRNRGLVQRIEAVKLQTPILGIKDVWRGYMRQGDGSEFMVFDFVGDPPEIKPDYDAWDIEGVFYRTVTYEDQGGRKRTIPYVLAKSIHLSTEPASKLGILDNPLTMLLGVVGLALFLARLLVFLAKTRRPVPAPADGGIRQLMERRTRKHSPPTPPQSS